MKLDNAKLAKKIRLIYMLIPLLIVAASALAYMYFDIKDLRYMVFAFILLLLFFIIMSIIRYNYIIYYAGPDKITIRYKSLSPLNTPSNSIQIKALELVNYKIKTALFGMRKVLYLYQQTSGGLAKYPGIGLSALKNKDIDIIKKSLDLILAINKNSG
jgi:uncharacterized membrane protein YdbT with pleckstrin-like domain